MSTEGDTLMACLTSRQDAKLDNVKFFRGTDELIPVSRFTEEFAASLKRSRKHNKDAVSTAFPKCKKAPVDVREFVSNI
jgi:hypothetical protein